MRPLSVDFSTRRRKRGVENGAEARTANSRRVFVDKQAEAAVEIRPGAREEHQMEGDPTWPS